MSIHCYRIYYRKNTEEIWSMIYEDHFSLSIDGKNREKVIKSLIINNYEYRIVDKFLGVEREEYSGVLENKKSLFDGILNVSFSEENVNVILNYFAFFQYFVDRNAFAELKDLRFTNHSRDLIRVIKAYHQYISDNLLTQNEMEFLVKAIQSDYKLLMAYLFFEYEIDRIQSGKFSRYADKEANEFFLKISNEFIDKHKNVVFTALFNSAVQLYRKNQIETESRVNLIKKSHQFSSLFRLIKRFGYTDFIVKSEQSYDKYYELPKDIDFTQEQIVAMEYAMAKQFGMYRFGHDNTELEENLKHERLNNTSSVNQRISSNGIGGHEKRPQIKNGLIIVIIVISIFAFIFSGVLINEFRYTYIDVNNSNYDSFINLNPKISETEYYYEAPANLKTYFYEVNLNKSSKTKYSINPEFMIKYTDSNGDSINSLLSTLSFESVSALTDVTILVSPTYQEEIKILKSDLKSLSFDGNPVEHYQLDIVKSEFHFKEISIDENNYSSYIFIKVHAPICETRRGEYYSTSYSISVSKEDFVEKVLSAQVSIRYELGNSGSSSSKIHIVRFRFLNQTITDNFGYYDRYDYKISSVAGKVVIRSYIQNETT